MMTHEQARALLLDLAYGELAPEELGEVSRHAAECSECAAELERIAGTRALAARAAEVPGPARDRSALVEAARRAAERSPRRRWLTPGALSFAAAAALVVIVTGVTLRLTGDPARRGGEGTAVESPVTPPAAPGPAAPAAEAVRPQAPAAEAAPPRATSPGPRSPEPAAAARPSAPRRKGAAATPPEQGAQDIAAAAPAPRAEAERRSAKGPGASREAVDEIERGLALGDLAEERRQLRCGEALVERTALLAGGRVVKVSERRGGALREAWYDGAGHLSATRTAGGDPGEARSAPPLPRVAPTLEAVATSCAW